MNNCKNCGHQEFVYRKVGNHIGQYCLQCETWQKWMPQNNPMEVMPFGKYKGQKISEIIDLEYLNWMQENCTTNPRLVKSIRQRLFGHD
jgi:hypothetical protein